MRPPFKSANLTIDGHSAGPTLTYASAAKLVSILVGAWSIVVHSSLRDELINLLECHLCISETNSFQDLVLSLLKLQKRAIPETEQSGEISSVSVPILMIEEQN